MNVYTMPPSQPFMQGLARWIINRYGGEEGRLVRARVLLPGRRACRSLQEAFLALSDGKPLLLPKIEPIGEISLGMVGAPHIQPMPAMRRQLLLMRLIADFEGKRQGRVYNMQKAAELATALAGFMDEVVREELDFAQLESLAPEELSSHWQQVLEFLHIISHHWPAILQEEGVCEPMRYRTQAIRNIAQAWQAQDPGVPIIAAGSTGSQPATAALLKVIGGLEQGSVILPGLDMQMQKAHWEALGPTHPQALLKRLLGLMGITRAQVQPLYEAHTDAKEACVSQVFFPALATSGWKDDAAPLEAGLAHIRISEAETELDEARIIAALLREALEEPGKTAALVTPDRKLASMVATQMQRYGVQLDDSAGRNLKDCPAAVYMRLLIQLAASGGAPVDLLAFLRHPLAACGLSVATCRRLSRVLEIQLLRGVRMEQGFSVLKNEAAQKGLSELKALLDTLDSALTPLMQLFAAQDAVPLAKIVELHIACAEALASTDEAHGRDVLWAKESGNHIASWLAELLEQGGLLPEVDPFIYPATFDTLLAGQSYWPRQTSHPRLHILSPIEARLLRYDRVILSGLNEGGWPASASADPWMSRPMREQFGLPLPERAHAQAAHDISQLMQAPEVYMTRARKTGGQPQVPSRWLVRLCTLVEGTNPALYARMANPDYFAQILAKLEQPAKLEPTGQPSPCPPVGARPSHMRVTQIDRWVADPYVVYAQHILRLRALDELDREPQPADFGNLVHDALRLFTDRWPAALPENPKEKLLACGHEVFTSWLGKPLVAGLWWPRFALLAEWFVRSEKQRREQLSQLYAEVEGQLKLSLEDTEFTLTTRIDRIEGRKDGSIALIDYKTGSVPSLRDIQAHKSNQLLLEALVVRDGTLAVKLGDQSEAPHFEYWKLGSKAAACEVMDMPLTTADIEKTRVMLEQLITAYAKPDMPYAAQDNSALQLDYNDYEHLTRRAEWESV